MNLQFAAPKTTWAKLNTIPVPYQGLECQKLFAIWKYYDKSYKMKLFVCYEGDQVDLIESMQFSEQWHDLKSYLHKMTRCFFNYVTSVLYVNIDFIRTCLDLCEQENSL